MLVEDGDTYKLKITVCNLVHENHPTGQEFSRLYPENRNKKMKISRRPKKRKISSNAIYKTSLDSIKIKYNTKHNSETVNAIHNDLTPSVAKLVTEQFYCSQQTQYLSRRSQTDADTHILSAATPDSSQYNCTDHSCSCEFFLKFNLPCQHIFALRSELCLPLYHCSNERRESTPTSSSSLHETNVTPVVLPTRHVSTPESRSSIIKEITATIESFLPSLGEHPFQTAIANLNKVLNLIKADRPLAVIDLSEYISPLTSTDNMYTKTTSGTQSVHSATDIENCIENVKCEAI